MVGNQIGTYGYSIKDVLHDRTKVQSDANWCVRHCTSQIVHENGLDFWISNAESAPLLGTPKINFARPGTVFFKYLWECNAFLKSFALFRRRIVLYVRNFQKYVIKSLVRSLDFNLPVFHVKRCQKYRLLFVGKDIQSDRIFFGSTLEQIRLTGFQHPF